MVHQIGTIRSDADAGRMKYIWQVRHSGLLGLKYFVAVQGHLVRGGDAPAVKPEPSEDEDVKPSLETGGAVLRAVVDAALVGLRDQDDDVRSAGAATLIPLAAALVEQLPNKLKEVVDVLWACLGDLKDDLSSSVGGVMDLLGSLIIFVPSSSLLRPFFVPSSPFSSDAQIALTAKLLGYPAVLDLLQSPSME
jgi:TATA-binding protein-associated factor